MEIFIRFFFLPPQNEELRPYDPENNPRNIHRRRSVEQETDMLFLMTPPLGKVQEGNSGPREGERQQLNNPDSEENTGKEQPVQPDSNKNPVGEPKKNEFLNSEQKVCIKYGLKIHFHVICNTHLHEHLFIQVKEPCFCVYLIFSVLTYRFYFLILSFSPVQSPYNCRAFLGCQILHRFVLSLSLTLSFHTVYLCPLCYLPSVYLSMHL